MPSIVAQDAARSWGPPLFQVDPSPNRAYGVEVAAEASLLDSAERSRRTADDFFASWDQGRLVSEPVYRLPEAAWERLRRHPRLYYRLHASASSDAWLDHLTTLPDAQAATAPWLAVFQLDLLPEDAGNVEMQRQVWQAAAATSPVQQVRALGQFGVLLYRHSFSPRRPLTPGALEWVVIVANLPQEPGEPVVTALVRLEFSNRSVLQQMVWQDAQASMDAAAAAERISASRPPFTPGSWQVAPDRLQRLGEFWVLWVPSPSPTARFGGTMIVQARTGRLVYSASTSWQGGSHLFP